MTRDPRDPTLDLIFTDPRYPSVPKDYSKIPNMAKSKSKCSNKGSVAAATAIKQTKPILFFRDFEQWGFFCQWYMVAMTDPESGYTFNCCEQYMMYHKAKAFGDVATMKAVMEAKTPKEHKALGKQVAGFIPEEWDRYKYDVVVRANILKFTQCCARADDQFVKKGEDRQPALRQLLLDTFGRELAEASRFDKVWGIGLSADRAESVPRTKWGQNLLGKALMEVRRRLLEEESKEPAT